ncbi:MAG: iron uptake porin [Cyanobacteria bacterium J06633_8]
MRKAIWKVLKLSPAIFAATVFTANSALAEEVNKQVTSVAELSEDKASMDQVTSVSQFSDVQPTDWAFQALQSLVERYGCIAGYPNGTYRGNRALTRYEFAAGLNACLDRVNELIATATADIVSREDLATLQRLQEEFSAELATLRGRVDALEARTAELEANQFSTTTKLKGEAVFNVTNVFGDENVDGEDIDSNVTFANRARLNFLSSFTGTDRLKIRLTSANIQQNNSQTGTRMTRLGFAGDNGNDVEIDKINYSFNLGPARVKLAANDAKTYDSLNHFNPVFKSSGGGSISRYGRFSPIYRLGGGGAGAFVTLNPKGKFSLSGAYLARENSSPDNGDGIFNGDNAIFGQLELKPSKALNVGLSYARTYNGNDNGSTTLNRLLESTGSELANRPFGDTATITNHYGVQAHFKVTSNISVGGWYGYADAEQVGGTGDGEIQYWAANLGIKDFGAKGSTLGLIFGQPPKLTDSDDTVNGEDPDTSYHLEALYKLPINDNIAITPGVLVIFNPEHDNDNDTIYVGTLRTTFKF